MNNIQISRQPLSSDGYYGTGKACTRGQCHDAACPKNKKCQAKNTIICICKDGFVKDKIDRCEDFDECAEDDGNECDENSICTNELGSYNCTCNDGYYGTGKSCKSGDCTDARDCGQNEECVSPRGGECRCKTGFERNRSGLCVDIDECVPEKVEQLSARERCHKTAKCTNSIGSYSCLCKEGFFGFGYFCTRGQCRDDAICKPNQQCKSKVEIKCVCKPGFVRNDNDDCVARGG